MNTLAWISGRGPGHLDGGRGELVRVHREHEGGDACRPRVRPQVHLNGDCYLARVSVAAHDDLFSVHIIETIEFLAGHVLQVCWSFPPVGTREKPNPEVDLRMGLNVDVLDVGGMDVVLHGEGEVAGVNLRL